jgi:hypothetical protein
MAHISLLLLKCVCLHCSVVLVESFFSLLFRLMFLLLRVICYIYVIFYLNKLVIIIFPTYFKFIRLEMFSSVFACASKIF